MTLRKQLLRFVHLDLGVLVFGHELCDEEELSLQIIFEREILCAQEMTNKN